MIIGTVIGRPLSQFFQDYPYILKFNTVLVYQFTRDLKTTVVDVWIWLLKFQKVSMENEITVKIPEVH